MSMTSEQERQFRGWWRKGMKNVVKIMQEKENNFVQIAKDGEYKAILNDPRMMAMGLLEGVLQGLVEQLKEQRLHEGNVDDLINLFGLKPDSDNLNPIT